MLMMVTSPPRPPSPHQCLIYHINDTDTNNAPEYDVALMLQDWDID